MECPIEPDQSECCNSGCNPCIFDVYEKQLQKYKQSLLQPQSYNENCLKELKYVPFVLVKVLPNGVNSNIYIFECNIEHSSINDCNVFVEPGQHILIRMKSLYDGNDFTRAYTPIPWEGLTKRQFAVLIKLYANGDMSKCIKHLKIGDVTYWRGPYGEFPIDLKQKGLFMIAQGTGIAPLFAISRKILDDEETELRIRMIYCCQSLRHMHLRNELYSMKEYWNFNYEVYLSCGMNNNCSDCSNESIEGEDSKINELEGPKYNELLHLQRLEESDIRNILDQYGDEFSQVLICGSELFMEALKETLKKYTDLPILAF